MYLAMNLLNYFINQLYLPISKLYFGFKDKHLFR